MSEEWHRFLRNFAAKCTDDLSEQGELYALLLKNSDDAAGAWGQGDLREAEELLRAEVIRKTMP